VRSAAALSAKNSDAAAAQGSSFDVGACAFANSPDSSDGGDAFAVSIAGSIWLAGSARAVPSLATSFFTVKVLLP
jgi:hypothetical protein